MSDVLHFQSWSILAKLENHLELEKKLTGPGPVEQYAGRPASIVQPGNLKPVRCTRSFPSSHQRPARLIDTSHVLFPTASTR
jgi:hypothetical protein